MEDNSVLNEDSNIEDMPTAPRKSLSQPTLHVEENVQKLTAPKRGLSGAHSTSNVRSIPIIQTWHENEELKGIIYSLKCDVQMNERRYLEAKEACHSSVQDVLDEYVELKIGKEEVDDKRAQFSSMETQIYNLQQKINENQDCFAEFRHQKEIMEQRIRELESVQPTPSDHNNTTFGPLVGTLDDIMKKNDPDFTLSSGYEERKIGELEEKLRKEQDKVAELEDHIMSLRQEINDQSARLADAENVRAQLEAAAGQGILGSPGARAAGATFMIENARESQTQNQLKYIDELEGQVTKMGTENQAVRKALVEYMNKCSKLETEIHLLKKNTTFDSSSMLVQGKTAEELKMQIEKVSGELNTLRAENRDLRIRCDQLTGGDGNVSISLGASRLMAAGAGNDDSRTENLTGGTSMRIFPRESNAVEIDESKLPLMDTSAAVRNKAEFDSAWEQFSSEKNRFISNDTIESSFNSSMPPPNRDATQSFLSQKGGHKNSPLAIPKLKDLSMHDQIQNVSFSTKTASPMMIKEVQNILDSSALMLEKQHESAADVEKMQAKMTMIREALSRVFERLKSSAALFEDILEKMGSSSPLADRIKEMKLAFETSICDNAELTGFIEAAEKDLTNMSINFSILEKSVVSQSFVADVSRRFTIAPDAEDIASSSLLNNSYSPIFKFSSIAHSEEVENMRKELQEVKGELEKARLRSDLRSPIQNSPSRLSDVQIKAAQNFEELEVCQATLKKVETEKAALMKELESLEKTNHLMTIQLGDVRKELQETQHGKLELEELKDHLKAELAENRNRFEDVDQSQQALIENLKMELKNSLSEETAIRDYMEVMKGEMEKLKWRATEAEGKVEKAAESRQEMLGQIVDLETQLEKMNVFEMESRNCDAKLAAKRKEVETTKQHEEFEKIATEGLERVQKALVDLSLKTLKAKIIKGNSSSVRLVCDELCRRMQKERERQHEQAEELKQVYENIEKAQKSTHSAKNASEKENAPPIATDLVKKVSEAMTSSSSKFVSPTRQLLHESTMAVDAIVQRIKKTQHMVGDAELKETILVLLRESRTLRDFLHQKLNLFKGIDMANCENEPVEQLISKIEQLHQDNLILEEQIARYKKELKQQKMNLGTDVQERIKKEIGGIAKDMGALKGIRNKK